MIVVCCHLLSVEGLIVDYWRESYVVYRRADTVIVVWSHVSWEGGLIQLFLYHVLPVGEMIK